MRFDVDQIPSWAVVSFADLTMRVTGTVAQPAGGTTLQAYRSTSDWNSNARWSNSGVAAWNGGSWSGWLQDERNVGAPGSDFHLYPTEMAQAWISKTLPNYGMVIKAKTEAASAGKVYFASAQSTTAPKPTLRVDWSGGLGDHPNQANIDQSLTDRCNVTANAGNGNLMLRCKEFAINGPGPKVQIDRVYNSGAGGDVLPRAASPLGVNRWQLAVGGYIAWGVTGVTYYDSSGAAWPFDRKIGTVDYMTPPGLDADLKRDDAADSYKLTFHKSKAEYRFEKRYNSSFSTAYQMVSAKDRNGLEVKFDYRGDLAGYQEGALDKITDPRGRVTTVGYTYDNASGKHFVSRVTAPDGRQVAYGYTGNNLTSATDADGDQTSYAYDGNGQVQTVTDPLGRTADFGYDPYGRVLDINRHPASGATENTNFTYNVPTSGDITTVVRDPRANNTIYTIENRDYTSRPIKSLDAKGIQRSATYTAQAKVGTATNGSNGQSKFEYNANAGESLTKAQGPMGATTSVEYDGTKCPGSGGGDPYQVKCSKDPSGNMDTSTYTGPGNQASNATADAATAKVNYADADTDPAPKDGRIEDATDPLTRKTIYNYSDAPGCTAAAGRSCKRLTGITPPAGSQLGSRSVTFDNLDRLATTTTGRGTVSTYSYDGNDRTTGITYSDSTPPLRNDYDNAGNLIKKTVGVGSAAQVTEYGYDGVNRLTSKKLPNGNVFSYEYDASGNLTKSTLDGVSTTYSYDSTNNLTSMVDRSGKTITFGYNADGKRTDTWYNANSTFASPPPSTWSAHVKATFDTANRLNNIKTFRASSDTDTFKVSDFTYCYQAYSAGTTDCTGAANTGAQTDIDGGSKDKNKRQWSRDNITQKVTTYSYDKAGRLLTADDPATTGTVEITYAYDKNGNRTRDTTAGTNSYAGYDTGNGLCATGSTANPACPADGNPSGVDRDYGPIGYDAAGNQTEVPGLNQLTYNGTDQTTSINGGGYAYAFDNQVERTNAPNRTFRNGLLGVQSETDPGTGQTTYYDLDPTGTPISTHLPNGTGGTTDYYYALDGMGSIVGLIDNTGTERAKYRYDPYGKMTTDTGINGAAPANPWRFQGQYLDPTGLYKIGLRYYDPKIGRWTQQDIIENIGDPKRANRYTAFGGDPVNNIDPSGADFFGSVGRVAGVASFGLAVAGTALDFAGLPEIGGPIGVASAGLSVVSAGGTCLSNEAGANCGTAAAGAALSVATAGVSTVSTRLAGANGVNSLTAVGDLGGVLGGGIPLISSL